MEGKPDQIMQDSMQLIATNYNPRTILMNEKNLDEITMDKIEKVYRDRIADASDFTFIIVGNIDAEIVKPMVEKYIGSISSTHRNEKWIDRKVRGPKGKTEKVIELELTTPKSTVITNFSKEMNNGIGYSVERNAV